MIRNVTGNPIFHLIITFIASQRPTKLLKTWQHVRSDWPNRSHKAASDWQPKGSQKDVWTDFSKAPAGLTHIQVSLDDKILHRNENIKVRLTRAKEGYTRTMAWRCPLCAQARVHMLPEWRYLLKQELVSFCPLRSFPPLYEKVLARWYANSLWLWKVLMT